MDELEIPEEYKDRPEVFFQKLEREETQARIRSLEEKLFAVEEEKRAYLFALIEIKSIVNIARQRIGPIREVLGRFPELVKVSEE